MKLKTAAITLPIVAILGFGCVLASDLYNIHSSRKIMRHWNKVGQTIISDMERYTRLINAGKISPTMAQVMLDEYMRHLCERQDMMQLASIFIHRQIILRQSDANMAEFDEANHKLKCPWTGTL